MKKLYPYQNTSLVNLRGEKWKDIPGFEGIYKISNFGRVLSCRRKALMHSPHGGEYFTKERIRKSHLDIKVNKTNNVRHYSLIISLYRDGNSYHFSLARLVYTVFKEKLGRKDDALWITYKDSDGRNVHVSNLFKSGISAIKLTSYKEGRATSHFKKLSKAVTQFDTKGNALKTYPSMYEAAKILGINFKNISEVATGRGHLYAGFFWKFGKHTTKLTLDKIDHITAREEIHSSLLKRLKIKKIDLNSPPAFLNLSIKSMKGELWKTVPGFPQYQVSNFGRAKALPKIIGRMKQQWMPEQIQRLTIDFRIDANGKEVPGSAFACMVGNGRKKMVSVPRLVYYLIVKKFDIGNTTLRVYYKDGNTLNLNYKNLMLKPGVWSYGKN